MLRKHVLQGGAARKHELELRFVAEAGLVLVPKVGTLVAVHLEANGLRRVSRSFGEDPFSLFGSEHLSARLRWNVGDVPCVRVVRRCLKYIPALHVPVGPLLEVVSQLF